MRLRWLVPLAAAAALAYAGLRFEHGLAHALGIDTQQSQEYDFVSGVGPMIIAALGYVSLATAAVHALNCHKQGCWRIGRHKIGGTPWCNRHHAEARPEQSAEDILRDLSAKFDTLIGLLHKEEHPGA